MHNFQVNFREFVEVASAQRFYLSINESISVDIQETAMFMTCHGVASFDFHVKLLCSGQIGQFK